MFNIEYSTIITSNPPVFAEPRARTAFFAGVKQFTAAAPQHDDMTAMVVSYRPPVT